MFAKMRVSLLQRNQTFVQWICRGKQVGGNDLDISSIHTLNDVPTSVFNTSLSTIQDSFFDTHNPFIVCYMARERRIDNDRCITFGSMFSR